MLKQFEIWTANLNSQRGSEAGKIRPVVVIQTNLLNEAQHPSTIICPLTTKVIEKSIYLRVHLKKGHFGLKKDSDIMIDQIRAIDNKGFIELLGV